MLGKRTSLFSRWKSGRRCLFQRKQDTAYLTARSVPETTPNPNRHFLAQNSLSPSDAAIRTFISEEKQPMKQQSQQKRQQHLWSWTLSIHHMNQKLESHLQQPYWNYQAQLQETATDSERNQERKHRRECHDMINEHMKEHDALFVLAEGQSLSSYKRMQYAQSFETPTAAVKKKVPVPFACNDCSTV